MTTLINTNLMSQISRSVSFVQVNGNLHLDVKAHLDVNLMAK